ncbi:hypothetical protein GCM10010411_75070 [Actinomadura fulvescens]|uniref:DUF4190 domain-containing protein n=1 Tax=Actinomadura fulvescens TaxID=46160 RepID=A0ABP6CSM4_9ACTN
MATERHPRSQPHPAPSDPDRSPVTEQHEPGLGRIAITWAGFCGGFAAVLLGSDLSDPLHRNLVAVILLIGFMGAAAIGAIMRRNSPDGVPAGMNATVCAVAVGLVVLPSGGILWAIFTP